MDRGPTRADSGVERRNKCVRETAMRRSGLDVSPVVTHRIVIAEFAEAIDIKTSTKSAKVVFDWEETA